MAYTRHFYPKLNFVLTQGSGTIDDQTLLIHLMSFRAESTKYKFIRELVDTRSLRNASKMTVQGLIRIAETHKELFPETDFLAAVLVNSTEAGKMAQIYSLLVSTMNLRVKVFQNDIDQSLAWLGYDNYDISKLKRFIDRHSKAR